MRTASRILLIIGIVFIVGSLILPAIMIAVTPQQASVGMIGGADAPSYLLMFRAYSYPLFCIGFVLIIVSLILYFVWKKKNKVKNQKCIAFVPTIVYNKAAR